MKRLLSLLLVLPAVHAENVITTSFNTLLAGMTPEIANYLYAFILVFTVTQFALNMIPNLGQNSTTGIATAFGFGSAFFVYMTNYNIIGATIPFIAFIVLGILSLMVWNVYSQFRHSGAGWVAALISSIGLIILGSTMSKIGDFLTYDNSSGTAEIIASLSPYLITFGILMAIASGIMAWRQLGLSAPGLPAVLRGGPRPAAPGAPGTTASPTKLVSPASPASPATPGTTQPVNSIGIVGIPVPPIDTSGITEPTFVLESRPDNSSLVPNNISPDDGHFTPDTPGIYVIHVFAQGNTETPVLIVTFDITPRPAGPKESNEDTNPETPAETEQEYTEGHRGFARFIKNVESDNNPEHTHAEETSEGMAVEYTEGEKGFAAFFNKHNPLTSNKSTETSKQVSSKQATKKVKDLWKKFRHKINEVDALLNEEYRAIFAYLNNEGSLKEGSEETIQKYLEFEQTYINQSRNMCKNILELAIADAMVVNSKNLFQETIELENYISNQHFPRGGKSNKDNQIWVYLEDVHQNAIKKMHRTLTAALSISNDIDIEISKSNNENFPIIDSNMERQLSENIDTKSEEEE